MNVHFPDHATVTAALEMANRAPSLHNSQPWQWRVGLRSIHLHAQPSRQLPHTDPDGRDLLVSCGATLHHCQIAFAALGWRAVVHRLPDPGQHHHLAAIELHRALPSNAEIALAAAIQQRYTDRRSYAATTVRAADIALMGARAARVGVTMRRMEPTTEFRALLAQAVWAHAGDSDYLDELAAWSGRHAADDGVPARNVPPSNPRAAIPGRLFADPQLSSGDGEDSTRDSGVLLALGTAEDDTMARLRAGEATSAVLLTATSQGLVSCLISEPLEVAETRQGVRQWAFDDREYPQMMIRVGWLPAGLRRLPPTPRRPLSDVVVRLDGGAFVHR
ncbi:NAD(P)H nitroreductase [Mycobacterium sp. MS1601]|uniref:Acg family FMN-binding oxidoreductase n=1 Tax=Mycobacterium sp. MS1601 TaxID=1936029 RepID=UPI00097907F1|nr:nitroreductase family protein [Mycobacterium sp. MS1601]AQA05132.1 NAD(P)H nitroreductase [Mycobacterium sp. MS1601]